MFCSNVPRFVLLASAFFIATIGAAPYQELIPKPGYVAVYIREGNTPLSEIHPRLAEAFNEIESESLTLVSDEKKDEKEAPVITAEEVESTEKKEALAEKENIEKPEEIKEEENKPAEAVQSPPNIEELTQKDKESDIASFDVVKMEDEKVEN
ncbi:uncharacterized protein LOC119669048 [Teleopsis dalmanni]|uniref:uncharacterized protein LOC119669048 n=1 Tax=Teleopsis dalmanni TaxID=139649 RepID=UPI000D32BBB6|nr:uncharacterized protein LOC119669048 [Teleopsis dalmanni]